MSYYLKCGGCDKDVSGPISARAHRITAEWRIQCPECARAEMAYESNEQTAAIVRESCEQRIAAAVAAEREACALVAEQAKAHTTGDAPIGAERIVTGYKWASTEIAAAIRARTTQLEEDDA